MGFPRSPGYEMTPAIVYAAEGGLGDRRYPVETAGLTKRFGYRPAASSFRRRT